MQAPIGPATTPELVTAVSAAGGLGCLAASWTSLGALREQLRAIRGRTDRTYCVNLVLAFDQRGRIDVLIEERVPVVSRSWGIDEAASAACVRRARPCWSKLETSSRPSGRSRL